MSVETIIVLVVIFFVVLLAGNLIIKTVCPSCGKIFATRTEKKESIGERRVTEQVQSSVPRNNGSNPPQWDTKITDYEVTFTKFKHYRKCKKCSHTWEEVIESKTGRRKIRESTW